MKKKQSIRNDLIPATRRAELDEGGNRIYSKNWDRTIPRDHV